MPITMLLPRESILENIRTTLAAVNGAGDYHTKVVTVTRVWTPYELMPPDQMPALLVFDSGKDDPKEEAAQIIQRTMTVEVWGYQRVSEKVDVSTQANYLIEDIVRCLKADKCRNRLATWTHFGAIRIYGGWVSNRLVGVITVVNVAVDYLYNDPQT